MLLLASLRLPLAVAAPTCDFNLFPGTSCTNKAFQQDSHSPDPAGSRRLLRLRLLLPQVGQHDEQRRLLRAMRRGARLQSLGVGLNALGAGAPWELPPENDAWPHESAEVPLPPPPPALVQSQSLSLPRRSPRALRRAQGPDLRRVKVPPRAASPAAAARPAAPGAARAARFPKHRLVFDG